MKILVSDKLSTEGVAVLEQAEGFHVDVRTGLDEDALCAIIGDYDGLIIRSATRVTPALLACADRLKMVGRAGIGVDNIDLLEASRRGIVVMNAPFGNAVTTAEHALALLATLTRHVAAADASMKDGKWEKAKFRGTEKWNKTLGILGWGNIGGIVADRANGMRMRVIACDPSKNAEEALAANVELVDFDTLLAESDFITIHAPLRPSSKHLFNADAFKKMKKSAMLINAARGGIVDEDALAQALQAGYIAGAALDVFEVEPLPAESPLRQLTNIVLTPHLGASTSEAQVRVGVQIAEQAIGFLRDGRIVHGVNTPALDNESRRRLEREVAVAKQLGSLLHQVGGGALEEVRIHATGDIADLGAALGQHTLAELLAGGGETVTPMSAQYEAKSRGVRVVVMTTPKDETSLSITTLRDGIESTASGRRNEQGIAQLTRFGDYDVDMPLVGDAIMIRNADKPGVIGAVGTCLGSHQVNVSRLHVALDDGTSRALACWSVDAPPSSAVIAALRDVDHVDSVIGLSFAE